MPRNPIISKSEEASLRNGLFGGMSKRQLELVVDCARRTVAPHRSLEDRMVDTVCMESQTLGQYWPEPDKREQDNVLAATIRLSVDTALADATALRRREAAFEMDVILHHPGHSLW